jgi:hypothetical protein
MVSPLSLYYGLGGPAWQCWASVGFLLDELFIVSGIEQLAHF